MSNDKKTEVTDDNTTKKEINDTSKEMCDWPYAGAQGPVERPIFAVDEFNI